MPYFVELCIASRVTQAVVPTMKVGHQRKIEGKLLGERHGASRGIEAVCHGVTTR